MIQLPSKTFARQALLCQNPPRRTPLRTPICQPPGNEWSSLMNTAAPVPRPFASSRENQSAPAHCIFRSCAFFRGS